MADENNNNEFIDLHIHTGYSDGAHGRPEDVAMRARKMGFKAIAITEHDHFESYPYSYKACKEAGVNLIPGVEITTNNPKRAISYHVLAYLFDPNNEKLIRFLRDAQEVFQHNLRQTLIGLKAMGYPVAWTELEDATREKYSYLEEPELHKPDIYVLSEHMVRKGYAPSTPIADQIRREALKLAHNVLNYAQQQDVFDAVKGAGGLLILAHPQGYIQEHFASEHLLRELVAEGLDGVEIFTPKHPSDRRNFYLQLIERVGCIGTGGSDCHDSRPGIPVCTLGRAQVPARLVRGLLTRHRLKYGPKSSGN
ncbi:MAG TPA: PHP domain-containing protein [Candidatus Brocadiia bacterium]|nr:PHP domain-containing protein [Candidatus Brocadiia bacterium]